MPRAGAASVGRGDLLLVLLLPPLLLPLLLGLPLVLLPLVLLPVPLPGLALGSQLQRGR